MSPKIKSKKLIVNNLLGHKELSAEMVARRTGVPVTVINKMLKQDCEVDLLYLVRIARLFHKHWTVFLLEKPLYRGIPSADLREGPHKEELSNKTVDALDNAQEIIDLANALNLEFKLNLPHIRSLSSSELAASYRKLSNITLADQTESRSSSDMYGKWVNFLQQLGVYVVKYRLDNSEIRAASIKQAKRAIIIINSNDTYNGQIFSLFHELAHLHQNTSGYCDLYESSENAPEAFCNSFSSNFLVPEYYLNDLEEYKHLQIEPNDKTLIKAISQKFKVSTLVVYRRMLDNGLISPYEYKKIHEEILENFLTSQGEREGGGNFYTTKIAQNSKLFIKQLFDAFYDKKIEYSAIASTLNIKIDQIKELRQRVNLEG